MILFSEMESLVSPQELAAARTSLAAKLISIEDSLKKLNDAAKAAHEAQCEVDRGTLEKLAALRLDLDATAEDLTAPTVERDLDRAGAGGVLLKCLSKAAEQVELIRSGLEHRKTHPPAPSAEIVHLTKRSEEVKASIAEIDLVVAEQRALAAQWLKS